MSVNFQFAIISDPHIALPETIWEQPGRFHLVEVSIPALEAVLARLESLDLDFLLLPGDLTQHGEPANHAWLAQRLAQLPFPVYVVPGNHDVVQRSPTAEAIGLDDFPYYYQKFGYDQPQRLYYSHSVLPGVRLIGLNSNAFDQEGNQIGVGYLDQAQLRWLEQTLATVQDELVLIMIHHNVIEHLPGQSRHAMGQRYMTQNAAELLARLYPLKTCLILTGHLHVQDIACSRQNTQPIYEITTGSLVSYPHPYRIVRVDLEEPSQYRVSIQTDWVTTLPDFPDLPQRSREWMGDRSFGFMVKLLTQPPFSLALSDAERIAPDLRYFWADIARGDAWFEFPHLPLEVNRYLQRFSAMDEMGQPAPVDNNVVLRLAPNVQEGR